MEPRAPSLTSNPGRQVEDRLRSLEVCFYTLSLLMMGTFLIFALQFFIVRSGMGAVHEIFITVSNMGDQSPGTAGGPDFAEIESLFNVAMGLAMLICFSLSLVQFFSGRAVACRRNRRLIFVAAALSCAFFPLGTLLGAYAFFTLRDPVIAKLFHPPGPLLT